MWFKIKDWFYNTMADKLQKLSCFFSWHGFQNRRMRDIRNKVPERD